MTTAPQARYEEMRFDIDTQLRRIKALLDHHTATERVTWSHVGDLGHVKEALEDVASFLNDEE